MANNETIRAEDVLPVRSRISWGAIFAGAMVALSLYFLLTLLGTALGLSVSDRVRPQTLGTAAVVWSIVVTMLSLFVGGYVTSQCSVGENRFEAALYGVILWGVLFSMLLGLMASGVRAGFYAMVGMSHATQAVTGDTTARGWEEMARRAGASQEQIDQFKKNIPSTDQARRTAEDPENQQAAAEAATRVTWWAFLGTLMSMLASIAGSCVGAGPTFRLVTSSYLGTRDEAGRRHPVGAGF